DLFFRRLRTPRVVLDIRRAPAARRCLTATTAPFGFIAIWNRTRRVVPRRSPRRCRLEGIPAWPSLRPRLRNVRSLSTTGFRDSSLGGRRAADQRPARPALELV